MANTGANEGLLGGMLSQMGLSGLSTKPQLTDGVNGKEFVLDITQEEFNTLATKNVQGTASGSVKLELHEGKMTIRVKLF